MGVDSTEEIERACRGDNAGSVAMQYNALLSIECTAARVENWHFDQFLKQKVNENNGLILLKSIYCIKHAVYTQKSKRSCEYTDSTVQKWDKKEGGGGRKKNRRGRGTADIAKMIPKLDDFSRPLR